MWGNIKKLIYGTIFLFLFVNFAILAQAQALSVSIGGGPLGATCKVTDPSASIDYGTVTFDMDGNTSVTIPANVNVVVVTFCSAKPTWSTTVNRPQDDDGSTTQPPPATPTPAPLDSDGDGIADNHDLCVNFSGGADTLGCPLEAMTGTVYACGSDVNIRTNPSTSNVPIGNMLLNTSASVTGRVIIRDNPNSNQNGSWYQVNYNGVVGYVGGGVVDLYECITPQLSERLEHEINVNCRNFFEVLGGISGEIFEDNLNAFIEETGYTGAAAACRFIDEVNREAQPLVGDNTQSNYLDDYNNGNCPDDYLAAYITFVDLMENFEDLNPDAHQTLRDAVDGLEHPCEFITALVQGNIILSGDLNLSADDFTLTNRVETLLLSCRALIEDDIYALTLANLISYGGVDEAYLSELQQDDSDNSFCDQVSNIILLGTVVGDNGIPENDAILLNQLRDACPSIDNERRLEIVVALTRNGINLGAVSNNLTPELCETLTIGEIPFEHFVSLDEIQALEIERIAGVILNANADTAPTCTSIRENELSVYYLTMLIWSRWHELSETEQDSLLSSNTPCESMLLYLATGELPMETSNPIPVIPANPSWIDRNFNVDHRRSINLSSDDEQDPLSKQLKAYTDVSTIAVILARTENGQLQIFTMRNGALELIDDNIPVAGITDVTLSPDGNQILFIGDNGQTMYLYDRVEEGIPFAVFHNGNLLAELIENLSSDAQIAQNRGITWHDGRVLFTLENNEQLDIYSLPADALISANLNRDLSPEIEGETDDYAPTSYHDALGDVFLYETIRDGNRQVAGISGAYELEGVECFEPGYNLDGFSFMYFCLDNDEVVSLYQRNTLGDSNEIIVTRATTEAELPLTIESDERFPRLTAGPAENFFTVFVPNTDGSYDTYFSIGGDTDVGVVVNVLENPAPNEHDIVEILEISWANESD